MKGMFSFRRFQVRHVDSCNAGILWLIQTVDIVLHICSPIIFTQYTALQADTVACVNVSQVLLPVELNSSGTPTDCHRTDSVSLAEL